MSSHEFIWMFWKSNITNLTICLDSMNGFLAIYIPHLYCFIIVSASSVQISRIEWRPSKCSYCSLMFKKRIKWRMTVFTCIEYIYSVLITTRSQKLFIRRPFNATNFLTMFSKIVCPVLGSQVGIRNAGISWATGNQVIFFPWNAAHSVKVWLYWPNLFLFFNINNIKKAWLISSCNEIASRIEFERGITLFWNFCQLDNWVFLLFVIEKIYFSS